MISEEIVHSQVSMAPPQEAAVFYLSA